MERTKLILSEERNEIDKRLFLNLCNLCDRLGITNRGEFIDTILSHKFELSFILNEWKEKISKLPNNGREN